MKKYRGDQLIKTNPEQSRLRIRYQQNAKTLMTGIIEYKYKKN